MEKTKQTFSKISQNWSIFSLVVSEPYIWVLKTISGIFCIGKIRIFCNKKSSKLYFGKKKASRTSLPWWQACAESESKRRVSGGMGGTLGLLGGRWWLAVWGTSETVGRWGRRNYFWKKYLAFPVSSPGVRNAPLTGATLFSQYPPEVDQRKRSSMGSQFGVSGLYLSIGIFFSISNYFRNFWHLVFFGFTDA